MRDQRNCLRRSQPGNVRWSVTFDTLPKTGGTFSDPLGRSMIRIDISEFRPFFLRGGGRQNVPGDMLVSLELYILNGRHAQKKSNHIPSLKLTVCTWKKTGFPKGNDRLPTIHFQGRTVSFTRWGSSRWRWRGHEALWCEVGFPGNPGQKATVRAENGDSNLTHKTYQTPFFGGGGRWAYGNFSKSMHMKSIIIYYCKKCTQIKSKQKNK